jgi:hypothetical protein
MSYSGKVGRNFSLPAFPSSRVIWTAGKSFY